MIHKYILHSAYKMSIDIKKGSKDREFVKARMKKYSKSNKMRETALIGTNK